MDGDMYRSDRSWRNAPPVRERDRRVARSLWILLIGIVAAIAPIAFYLVQQARFVQTQYRLTNVLEVLDRAADVERHLQVECAELEVLPRVERAARDLGLRRPTPESLVVVRAKQSAPDDLLARAPDDRTPAAR